MAQERITVDEAYAGDILGVWDGGNLRIGDTLVEGRDEPVEFEAVPRFSPEHFVRVTLADPMKRKQLKKGLEQLSEEGAVQLFFVPERLERDPDPRRGRRAAVRGDPAPPHVRSTRWRCACGRCRTSARAGSKARRSIRSASCARASAPASSTPRAVPLVLFENDWALRTTVEKNPELRFIAAVQPARSGPRAAA